MRICQNEECGYEDIYLNYKNHDDECEYNEVICENLGCNEIFFVKEY